MIDKSAFKVGNKVSMNRSDKIGEITQIDKEGNITVDFGGFIKRYDKDGTEINDFLMKSYPWQLSYITPYTDAMRVENLLKECVKALEKAKENLTEEKADKILSFLKVLDKEYELEKTTQEEPRWIPVTERLPKNDEDVLVCYPQGGMEVVYYHIDDTYYPTQYADLNETGWFNKEDDALYFEPIAWIPLPEPYKEKIKETIERESEEDMER